MLTCRLASRVKLTCSILVISLGTTAGTTWAAPAPDVDAVLASLPLPPDIEPPTEASLKHESPLRKLALRKPIAEADLRSGFGIRRHPILHSSKMHTGVDWGAPLGAPILSASDGTVIRAEWAAGYGRRVEIQHAGGIVTAYSHMSRFSTNIELGTQVREGEVIGFVGSTGLSTGPHLHFEVLVNGRFVDPMDIYLRGGISVTAKVERKTPPTDGRVATAPAERVAALQARQVDAVEAFRAPTAPAVTPGKPSQGRAQTVGQIAGSRIAAAPPRSDEKWAEHERRMKAIQSKITPSTLMILR